MTKIRRAQISDAEELARLSSQLGYLVSGGDLARMFAVLDIDSDHAVFVAEKKLEGLAGFGHVYLTRRLFLAPFAELGGLIVDRDSRGLGLGAALMEAAEGWAVEQGANMMRVRSNVLREEARGFYLGLGYQDNKKQTVFIKSISR